MNKSNSIKFWIREACKTVVYVLLSSILYSVFMGLLLSDADNLLMSTIASASIYMIMMALIYVMTYPISIGNKQIPMVLSFGSTRKEAFIGIQITLFFELIIVGLIAYLFFILNSMPEAKSKVFELAGGMDNGMGLLLISYIIFSVSISIYGIASSLNRGPKNIYIIIYVFGFIALWVIFMMAMINGNATVYQYMESNATSFAIILLVTAVILYIPGAMWLNRLIKKMEVRL